MGLLVKLVQVFALPQRLLRRVDGETSVHRDGIGGVGLQLEGIDSGGSGGLDQGQGAAQILVVVARHLGNDKRLVRRADGTPTDGYFGHDCC